MFVNVCHHNVIRMTSWCFVDNPAVIWLIQSEILLYKRRWRNISLCSPRNCDIFWKGKFLLSLILHTETITGTISFCCCWCRGLLWSSCFPQRILQVSASQSRLNIFYMPSSHAIHMLCRKTVQFKKAVCHIVTRVNILTLFKRNGHLQKHRTSVLYSVFVVLLRTRVFGCFYVILFNEIFLHPILKAWYCSFAVFIRHLLFCFQLNETQFELCKQFVYPHLENYTNNFVLKLTFHIVRHYDVSYCSPLWNHVILFMLFSQHIIRACKQMSLFSRWQSRISCLVSDFKVEQWKIQSRC